MAQEREGKEEFKADHATSAGASMPGSKVKAPPLIRIPSQKLSVKIKKKNIKDQLYLRKKINMKKRLNLLTMKQ